MSQKSLFLHTEEPASLRMVQEWTTFLKKNNFDFALIDRIDLTQEFPQIFDKSGNKFTIDFLNDRQNYQKKKSSIKNELMSRALGAGRSGLRVLDLSAGLGIDSVFLAQLGYSVTAIERNPLIFLALQTALKGQPELSVKFQFGEARDFLMTKDFKTDVIYFDPMFPEKTKSALPRQEMVFFRNLVGSDSDATEILECAIALSGVKRVVVKRPIKAPALMKTANSIEGKLIRFDLYRGASQ